MRYERERVERKARLREEIVLTAAELFLKQGVQGVSMTQIADASEIGVATLYRYFGTKSGILVEVATLLWADLSKLFEGIFEADGYWDKTGLEQMEELLGLFPLLYENQKSFLRFIREFDSFVLQEKLPAEKLHDYETSILNFYSLFESAYQKACAEGSARSGIDIRLLYHAVSHALISTSQKFVEGAVLLEDNEAARTLELKQLVEMVLYYLKKS